MSQPKTPPGGPTPRVHHNVPHGQAGTPVSVNVQGAGVFHLSPEDYANPAIRDFLQRYLPQNIVYVNGRPMAAGGDKPPVPVPVLTAEQAARKVCDALFGAFTQSPEMVWDRLGDAIQLAFLQDGIDPGAVAVERPFNSKQVCDGGVATIRAVQTHKKAECMEVDIVALGGDLAAEQRIERAQEVLEPAVKTVNANQSVTLNRIADRVDGGLKLGKSVIEGDGTLSYILQPAVAIRQDPVDAGLSSKAHNARTKQTIRQGVQAELESAQPKEMPAQSTTTVTTQTAPAPGTAPSTKGTLTPARPGKK